VVGKGAPDYTHLRQILARDASGKLVPVACDPSGRIILLPYGTQTVAQDDPTRTIQGADGLTLHTIAVDGEGRLIMLPYGWDGATYRKLKVDDEGRMIGVLKGQADVKWGLRGWWKFVASEGTTIKDYSGYANNGSALSGVGAEAKYEGGVIGQAIELDGVDDRIVCSTTNHITAPPFTFEAWVYPNTLHTGTILSKGNVNVECGFVWRLDPTGLVVLYAYDGAAAVSIASAETYNIEEWTHLVITVDADWTTKFYLNGVHDVTRAFTGTSPFATADALNVGRLSYAAGWFFDGLLDEVRMYGRVLSDEEIAWRYANTNPAVGKPTRMIAVDSEGRMEVNLKDLPYKGQVLEQKILPGAGGVAVSISTAIVPEGKVWVITKAIAYTDTAALDSIDIGIYDGVDNYIIAACREVNSCIKIETNNDMILKAGDKISAGFGGLPANWVVGVVINGYELDAP